MKKLIFIITISFVLFSCGNETLDIELNLVFDHSLGEGKYPEYFKDLTMPFSSDNCSKNYLLKPINIGRLDISKKLVETNAWHFENRGNELTIDYVTSWLSQYYSDSLMVKHLTLPTKKSINKNTIIKYINKKKSKYDIFIFSEESELDEFNGLPVLHAPKDVNQKIQEISCNSKNKKVIILVNPIFLDEDTDISKTIIQLIEEADILFDRKEYEAAKLIYLKVLDLDAGNEIVQRKITIIVDEIKKKNEIAKLTSEADVLFTQKNYKNARNLYREINKKYPDIKHVVDRINEINRLLNSPKTYKITNDGSSWSKKQNDYYSNYGKYEGGITDGKMHGQGTLVFSKSHLIPVPKHSSYKVNAMKGDKLSGRFNKGYFVTGVLYDKNGKKKKSILPGE